MLTLLANILGAVVAFIGQFRRNKDVSQGIAQQQLADEKFVNKQAHSALVTDENVERASHDDVANELRKYQRDN